MGARTTPFLNIGLDCHVVCEEVEIGIVGEWKRVDRLNDSLELKLLDVWWLAREEPMATGSPP